jgi:hypothetical protein
VTPQVGSTSYFSLDGLEYEAADPGPGLSLGASLIFKSELRAKCVGLIALSFVSKTRPSTLFALPRIAWEDLGTGQIKVANLLGVVPGSYALTLLAIAG